jgi:hypothetical protein
MRASRFAARTIGLERSSARTASALVAGTPSTCTRSWGIDAIRTAPTLRSTAVSASPPDRAYATTVRAAGTAGVALPLGVSPVQDTPTSTGQSQVRRFTSTLVARTARNLRARKFLNGAATHRT